MEKNEVSHLTAELDKENDKVMYEVEFKQGGYEYNYYIDATSGKVLHYEKEFED